MTASTKTVVLDSSQALPGPLSVARKRMSSVPYQLGSGVKLMRPVVVFMRGLVLKLEPRME